MMSRRRGIALLGATVAALGLALAVPAAAVAAPAAAPATAPAAPKLSAATYSGTVKLSNCSGSIVRWNDSQPTDTALMLTNGHCYQIMGANDVFVNVPSVRTVTLLKANGTTAGTVQTTTLLYSTMHGTDVSLYQLGVSYQTLQQTYGVPALTIAPTKAVAHQPISVVSGYWKIIYTCSLNGFVYQLHEDVWSWSQSLRYSDDGCHVIGGTSGSPVLDANNNIIGVNNTINEDGARCTLNNPCEVTRTGHISVHQNRGYGQQTYLFYGCLNTHNQIDLTRSSCKLAKP